VAASTPHKKRSKDSKATAGLVFEDLSAALAASKPGDIIELPPGTHEISEDEDVIKYSLQIVGMGDGVVLAWEAETMITVKAADVRIANLKIDGARVSSEGLVRVEDGGRVWLDECNIAIKDGRVSVHKDSSATLTRCTLRGGQGPAIEIDPQAKAVLVKDCSITGSGAGDDGPEPWYVPGETGAVEISASQFGNKSRTSSAACVHLTIRGTTIVSCFGPAVTYRTNYHGKEHRQFYHFQWPGSTKVAMEGNTFKSNGVALPPGSAPEGEEIVHNEHPEDHDR